jgi:hypothetical protein
MDQLRDCYERLRHIAGPGIESFDVVRTVEEYRQYWRPERVRLLLLAESHRHS